jgi:molybdopterin-guanine dinucleotide biosynthesis protein A
VSTTEVDDASAVLAVVVLAGGAGRRLGGADKPGLDVGGRTLLDHVLLACPERADIVVVGPRRPTAREVRWTREQPPGGGPVAGLAAGLRLVAAPIVLVLAADLPLVGAALAPLLRVASQAVADGRDGAWVVDDQGHGQPLVSCLAVAPLRAAMPAEPRDRPLHQVLAGLRLDRVNAPEGSVSDVDTPQDLADIRQDLHRQHGKDTHE